MAAPGFYSQNLRRAYPFVRTSVAQEVSGPLSVGNLDNLVVVDAGFRAGPKSRFVDGLHSVYLSRISRSGSTFYLEFESDAPGLWNVPITFTRQAGDPDFVTEFANTGSAGISESSLSAGSESFGACEEPLWSGFLVTGEIAALELLLPGDGSVGRQGLECIVEPALVQNLAGAYVTRFAIANADRSRVDAPDDCDLITYPFTTGLVYIFHPCVTGEIVIVPGYNALVRQTAADNSITLGAAVGAGAGQPCGEVPVFPGEPLVPGTDLFSGGPRCNQVLRSLNGSGGRMFSIIAGTGVTITPVPETNTVKINVDMSGLLLCPNAVSQVSESCP